MAKTKDTKDINSKKPNIIEIYGQEIQQPQRMRVNVLNFKLLLLVLLVSLLGGFLASFIRDNWIYGGQSFNQPNNSTSSVTTSDKSGVLDLNFLLKDNNDNGYSKVLGELKSRIVGFYRGKEATANIFDSLYLEKDFLGSGVVITSDGWLLVPKAVVKDQDYIVVTSDNKIFKPQKTVVDNFSGSVLVKIEAKNLSPVRFSDMASPKSTDSLLILRYSIRGSDGSDIIKTAISKFAYHDQSKGADFLLSTEKEDHYLKTAGDFDNFYNGAVIFNDQSEVVGLLFNSGRPLINLAVPAYYLKSAVNNFLASSQEVIRASLGVNYLNLSETLGLPDEVSEKRTKGAVLLGDAKRNILAVAPESAAAIAGLQAGDIVLKINGDEVNENNSLTKLIQEYTPGKEITLTVLRKGKEQEVKVTLGEIR